MWKVPIVHVPDNKDWCLEHGQFPPSLFRTSTFDARSMDRIHCPYVGHQKLMSWIRTVSTVHVLHINDWCPEYGQYSRYSQLFTVHIPNSKDWCPLSGIRMGSDNCPYSGHQLLISSTVLMSGIWPVNIVHILDIVNIPDMEYGRDGLGYFDPHFKSRSNNYISMMKHSN